VHEIATLDVDSRLFQLATQCCGGHQQLERYTSDELGPDPKVLATGAEHVHAEGVGAGVCASVDKLASKSSVEASAFMPIPRGT